MAFFEEFMIWARWNYNLSFVPTLTQERPNDWRFEVGAIDQWMLSGYISDLHAPIYYLVGPPTMVAAMKELLAQVKLDENQIRSEDFVGY